MEEMDSSGSVLSKKHETDRVWSRAGVMNLQMLLLEYARKTLITVLLKQKRYAMIKFSEAWIPCTHGAP